MHLTLWFGVFQQQLRIPQNDTKRGIDLVGNACVGFYGLEEYESLAAASESLVHLERVYQPAAANRGLYDDLYRVFRSACVGLAETFRGLG